MTEGYTIEPLYPKREVSALLRGHLEDVGPGWRPILTTLDQHFQETMKKANLPLESVRILQVKEKFGGLRFYYSTAELTQSARDHLDRLVEFAESLSLRTCEECGKPGEPLPSKHGWVKTLCPEHHAARNSE